MNFKNAHTPLERGLSPPRPEERWMWEEEDTPNFSVSNLLHRNIRISRYGKKKILHCIVIYEWGGGQFTKITLKPFTVKNYDISRITINV